MRTRAFSFPLPPSPHTNSARFPYQFGNDCTPIQHTVYANYPPTSHELSTSSLPDFYQLHTELLQNHRERTTLLPSIPSYHLSIPITVRTGSTLDLLLYPFLTCSRSVVLPCLPSPRSRPNSPHNRKARITPGFVFIDSLHFLPHSFTTFSAPIAFPVSSYATAM